MIYSVLLCCFAQLHSMSPVELDVYLKNLKTIQPEYSQRLSAIAKEALGTPYHDGPLGEGAGAKYDPDPIVDLSRVDCVTYIEQSCALALADNFEDAVADLQKIRYKGGKVDFETRNHFMISDWIANNRWCKDVTRDLGIECIPLTRTISKREFFPKVGAPELGQNTPDQEITIHYIPIELAAEVEQRIPTPAIVVFIGKIDWLFALHCGLQLQEDNGEKLLYQASSTAEKVIAGSLAEYAKEQQKRYLGFTVYAITEATLEP